MFLSLAAMTTKPNENDGYVRRSGRKRKPCTPWNEKRYDISFKPDDTVGKLRLLLYEQHEKSPLHQELTMIVSHKDKTTDPAQFKIAASLNDNTFDQILSSRQFGHTIQDILCICLQYPTTKDFEEECDFTRSLTPQMKRKEIEALETSIIDSLMEAECDDHGNSISSNKATKKRRTGKRGAERGFSGTLLQSVMAPSKEAISESKTIEERLDRKAIEGSLDTKAIEGSLDKEAIEGKLSENFIEEKADNKVREVKTDNKVMEEKPEIRIIEGKPDNKMKESKPFRKAKEVSLHMIEYSEDSAAILMDCKGLRAENSPKTFDGGNLREYRSTTENEVCLKENVLNSEGEFNSEQTDPSKPCHDVHDREIVDSTSDGDTINYRNILAGSRCMDVTSSEDCCISPWISPPTADKG